jgi:hypothetical protein
MVESKQKLGELARLDKERMMLEEVRNNFESYMYHIKNKLADDEEAVAAVSTQEQRDELLKSAADAEDWMYDEGYDASLEVYKAKYDELTAPAEKVFSRVKEVPARAQAISELNKKLDKVVSLMKKWETTMPQITEEERTEILGKVEDVRTWISEKEEAQAAADPAGDPVFTSAEVPLQTQGIQASISKLSRRPKPAPKKEEKKNETDTEEKKEADSEEKKDSEEATDAEEKKEADSDEKSEDSKPSEEKTEEEKAEDEL